MAEAADGGDSRLSPEVRRLSASVDAKMHDVRQCYRPAGCLCLHRGRAVPLLHAKFMHLPLFWTLKYFRRPRVLLMSQAIPDHTPTVSNCRIGKDHGASRSEKGSHLRMKLPTSPSKPSARAPSSSPDSMDPPSPRSRYTRLRSSTRISLARRGMGPRMAGEGTR